MFFIVIQFGLCIVYSRFRRVLATEWVFKLVQLELFCQRSGKLNKMPYLETFMSLHCKDAGLKGHRLMVQRKGNFL